MSFEAAINVDTWQSQFEDAIARPDVSRLSALVVQWHGQAMYWQGRYEAQAQVVDYLTRRATELEQLLKGDQ